MPRDEKESKLVYAKGAETCSSTEQVQCTVWSLGYAALLTQNQL